MSEIQFLIDREKCSGCGRCAADCQRRVLEIRDGKAVVVNEYCFKCGHCLAICPENAVTFTGSTDEIWEISGRQVFLDEYSLIAHLKARRSVRQFKDTPVEKKKIDKIIEAGRLSPTASNSQNVRYIVVQKEIDAMEDAVLAQYKSDIELPHTYSPERLKRGFLFHNAPLVILVISPSEINGCLAAMSMELMAEALGLGTVYVGLFTKPANQNVKLRESLGLTEEEKIASCLAIGYSNIKFLRTAPKKAANVGWR